MVDQSQNVFETFDDIHLNLPIMKINDRHSGRPEALWLNDELGIRKELLTFNFVSMQRPSIRSKCRVILSNISAATQNHDSLYLNKNPDDPPDGDQCIQLNTACTPLDYIIELVLQQMVSGEKSRCFIRCNNEEIIQFDIDLLEVLFTGYLHELSLVQLYDWAEQAKANGVAMYKRYPKFAQRYFNDAAKALISFKPFKNECEWETNNGIAFLKVQTMFDSICVNIAACLLKEGRYDETLAVLLEQTDRPDATEKACYRRALAHFNLKQYEEALLQLQRYDWKQNRDATVLYSDIMQQWSSYKETYANMVKKMFG